MHSVGRARFQITPRRGSNRCTVEAWTKTSSRFLNCSANISEVQLLLRYSLPFGSSSINSSSLAQSSSVTVSGGRKVDRVEAEPALLHRIAHNDCASVARSYKKPLLASPFRSAIFRPIASIWHSHAADNPRLHGFGRPSSAVSGPAASSAVHCVPLGAPWISFFFAKDLIREEPPSSLTGHYFRTVILVYRRVLSRPGSAWS